PSTTSCAARRLPLLGRNIPRSGRVLDVCSVAERARLRDALRAGSEGGVPKAHPPTSRLHRSGRSRIESAPPAARATPSAPTWHVPLPVLSGPPGSRLRAASAFGYRVPTAVPARRGLTWNSQGQRAKRRYPLREIRAARIGDARIGQDVDQRRAPAGERALERRPQLGGCAHQLAVAAERGDHIVVAR